MRRSELTRDDCISILRESPVRITEIVDGLEADQFRIRPNPNDWSLLEILAHIRHLADFWDEVVRRTVSEDHPVVSVQDWLDRDTDETGSMHLAWHKSLTEFTEQRALVLPVFDALSDEDWRRKATRRSRSGDYVNDLTWFIYKYATHEDAHVKQIRSTSRKLRRGVSP